MRWLRPLLVSALTILFTYTFAEAQQNQTPERPQDFVTAVATATAACKALWADHAFDPMRDKVWFGDEKPTFAMLTNRARLLPKEKPLADLARKTLEKCRTLHASAWALLPYQTQVKIHGFETEEDTLIAQLYVGKITFGELNAAMSRIRVEVQSLLFGDVRPPTSNIDPKKAPQEIRAAKPPLPQLDRSNILHQTRLALVIGNSKYVDLPKLTNPTNDARAVADTLRELGFETTLVTDASEQGIRRAVRKFADQSGQADLALVYYAGHGAQVNGENYLLPIDMEIPHTEADIELSSLKVDDVVNSIRSTTKIVFLDACRDNPALYA
jgi:hypothetical protein